MRKDIIGIDFSQAQGYSDSFVEFPEIFESANQSVHCVEHRRIIRQTSTKGDDGTGQIAVGDLVDRIVVIVFRRYALIVHGLRRTRYNNIFA